MGVQEGTWIIQASSCLVFRGRATGTQAGGAHLSPGPFLPLSVLWGYYDMGRGMAWAAFLALGACTMPFSAYEPNTG